MQITICIFFTRFMFQFSSFFRTAHTAVPPLSVYQLLLCVCFLSCLFAVFMCARGLITYLLLPYLWLSTFGPCPKGCELYLYLDVQLTAPQRVFRIEKHLLTLFVVCFCFVCVSCHPIFSYVCSWPLFTSICMRTDTQMKTKCIVQNFMTVLYESHKTTCGVERY